MQQKFVNVNLKLLKAPVDKIPQHMPWKVYFVTFSYRIEVMELLRQKLEAYIVPNSKEKCNSSFGDYDYSAQFLSPKKKETENHMLSNLPNKTHKCLQFPE